MNTAGGQSCVIIIFPIKIARAITEEVSLISDTPVAQVLVLILSQYNKQCSDSSAASAWALGAAETLQMGKCSSQTAERSVMHLPPF